MATPYNKVRISGTMPGGELWSVNPCFGRVDGSSVDNFEALQDWADNIADGASSPIFGSTMLEVLSNVVRITQIRTEYYDATGRLADVAEAAMAPSLAGSAGPNKPYQSAIALSLRTARPGRSFRGRLYWPALNLDLIPASLRIPAVYTQGLAADTVNMLNTLAALDNSPAVLQPIVVSQTLGVNSVITRVEVGDIMDVQRRRRDALEENYAVSPIVPA